MYDDSMNFVLTGILVTTLYRVISGYLIYFLISFLYKVCLYSRVCFLFIQDNKTIDRYIASEGSLEDKIVCVSKDEYLCTLCQKTCKTKRNIVRHMNMVHLKIRDSSCSYCNKEFSQKSDCVRHEKTCRKRPDRQDTEWFKKNKSYFT